MTERHVILIVDDTPENLEVLDIMMPEMDGYEVCRRLKAKNTTRDIPVVFLTAMVHADDEAKGLAQGAVDYITKPFKLELVKARVMNHLSLRRAQLALERYNAQLEEMVQERTRQLAEALERLKSLDSAKDDFLQLSKMKVGETQPTLEQIDLEKVLLAAKANVREWADPKSICFSVSSPRYGFVMGNVILFEHAVTAILHALIMTAAPATILAIDCNEQDQQQVCLSITVQGKPLSEEEIKVFFEPFSKLRSSSSLQSLGIDLPLAAKIIKSMGGRMEIRNHQQGVQALVVMKKNPCK